MAHFIPRRVTCGILFSAGGYFTFTNVMGRYERRHAEARSYRCSKRPEAPLSLSLSPSSESEARRAAARLAPLSGPTRREAAPTAASTYRLSQDHGPPRQLHRNAGRTVNMPTMQRHGRPDGRPPRTRRPHRFADPGVKRSLPGDRFVWSPRRNALTSRLALRLQDRDDARRTSFPPS